MQAENTHKCLETLLQLIKLPKRGYITKNISINNKFQKAND